MPTPIQWTELATRFWTYVKKTDTCWLWTAGRFTNGYGQFRAGTRKVKAHRFAYQITFGEILDGLRVLHRCDTPACVRPDHLFLGTDGDNATDRTTKGRTKNGSREHPELWTGERNPAAKITRDVALQIREQYTPGVISLKDLGRKFGISQSQTRNIVTGAAWKEAS